jgi:hypothetical protein
MTEKLPPKPKTHPKLNEAAAQAAQLRREREAAALRENLRRRKAQRRARQETDLSDESSN